MRILPLEGPVPHLRHYSHAPITRIESREQVNSLPPYKPCGFWVSVEGNGDGWADWCEAEEYSGGWTYVYDVYLSDTAEVLLLETVDDLYDFAAEYSEEVYNPDDNTIDWRKVAENYDGIIISPYQGARAGWLFWYYGWDVASGCIWNAEAIERLELVQL